MPTLIPELDTTNKPFGKKHQMESPFAKFWRRFWHNRQAVTGFTVLLVIILVCLASPLFTKWDPITQDLSSALQKPSATHIMGTDYLGRDVLTRLLYGGRITLMISFLSVILGLLIGVPLGAISGYFSGWVDVVIQRIADILLSFPSFLLALTLVALMGVGVRNLIIAVGIMSIPSFMRLVRASVLTVREQVYIEAARSLGVPEYRILLKHVLPNSLTPVIINASLSLGYALTTSAGLGFLGLGVQSPTPEWGMMLGEARNYIFSHPYMITFPGLVIFVVIIALNLLGDGLRDALDPRLDIQG